MRDIKDIEKLMDEALKGYMRNNIIPGVSVGIVLDGEIALAKGYGVKNIESGEAVTEKSMFHSASISKTFVVTSLMQLHEKGLLDLNKHVVEYLPYFKLQDERYKDITVKQMMSHISGMPDVYDYEWEKPQYGEDALENYVMSIYEYDLLWEPGTAFSYSNLAYEILGDVIAKLSGMSFEAYVKRNILQPLGMLDSSFLIEEVGKEAMTSPHVMDMDDGPHAKVNGFYPYNRIHGPSSTLWSNAVELSKYAIANLNNGSFEAYQLLGPESYEMMWKPYAETNKNGSKIGLSWFLKDYKGTDIIFHTGGDTGYTSNLVLIPQHKAALVFYCDCDYINLNMVTDHLLDIILGFEVQPLLNSARFEVARLLVKEGIASAMAGFDEIRNHQRDKYYISEMEFNSLAYNFMTREKLDKAVAVLQMAISELPESDNLYDSLGEMYLKKGDREEAISCYKKSLKLNPLNASSIEALRKIGI